MQSTLSLSQRIAIQLRLQQRIILTALVKGEKKQSRIGLGVHTGEHRCASLVRIDWHESESTQDKHPEDFIKVCPAQFYDPVLTYQVNQAIEMEDLGGLSSYETLPWRMVQFYQQVLSARDRFLAERDYTQSKLYQ